MPHHQPTIASRFFAQALFAATDAVSIIGSGYAAYALRFGTWEMWPHYRGVLAIAVFSAFVIFSNFRLYDAWYEKPVWQRLQSLLAGWTMVALTLIVLGFVFKESTSYSRLWFGFWGLLGAATLPVLRTVATRLLIRMRSGNRGRSRVIVIGQGAMAEHVVRRAHASDHSAFEVCRVMPLDYDQPITWLDSTGVSLLSKRTSLARFIERAAVDEVWFCLDLRDEYIITDIQAELRYATAAQRFIPNIDAYRILRHDITEIMGLPAIGLNNSPIQGMNWILKAVEDRLLSAIILVCISPVFLVIAVGVKLSSPGPVFFRQERVSWSGRRFKMLKFRSMPVGIEDDTGPVWAQQTANRATWLGNLLRRTSLDELPQFINVIKGDMSIVGPRPERPEFVRRFNDEIPHYMQKHLVKAGITGLAQINGWRGDTDLRKRIEWDLYYIENWSLWLDFKIIALTPFKGLVHENAY